jgi:probable HAF family extracellular repeat protein
MKTFQSFSVVISIALGVTACGAPTGGESDPSPDQASNDLPGALRGRTGYRVTPLSSLGGTRSIGNSINNLSWVAGTSRLVENQTIHASLWFGGRTVDLGTLGGVNSGVIWPVKNVRGMISGIAETAEIDPLGENWSCSAFFPSVTGHVCRGFVWEHGQMRALPTFGGTHGFATGTNNRGQTVGWAENTVRDPSCNPPQVLQFRAALWGPRTDQIVELAPFAGDTTTAATAINDRGQVVGISGICSNAVGEYSAAHAVLWEGGRVIDLGNLGGVAWNTPMALNQRGDVVGFANAPDTDPPNDFNVRAFLWTKRDGMRDLGTLAGDATSQALGINERRQVVGVSCGATCRAFIWEDGIMTDLNDLVASGTTDSLRIAGDINDRGQISGQTVNAANERSAFVAYPTPLP